jgi:2-phosphosulfolactate phosphatase
MQIVRRSLAEGAAAARGIAIIVDVFRAFTCEPLLLHCGARAIILEGDPDRCRALRASLGDAVLVGEHNEIPIAGFDFTNSPSHILAAGAAVFAGRTVIHRTTSGVTGAIAALEVADAVFLASFINARATAQVVASRKPALVSVVAMGVRSAAPAPEDELCGDYLESLLTGSGYDHARGIARVLADETAQKFLRGDKPYLPQTDPVYCLQRDLFGFALQAQRRDGMVVVTPVPPEG